MIFEVHWEPDAKSERHLVWVDAADPRAMREAAEQAEIMLARDPEGIGEFLAEGLWKLVNSPIAVYYRIDHDNRTVHIENVSLLAGHQHP